MHAVSGRTKPQWFEDNKEDNDGDSINSAKLTELMNIKPKVVINRIFLFLITSILNQITIARSHDDSVLNTELSVLF